MKILNIHTFLLLLFSVFIFWAVKSSSLNQQDTHTPIPHYSIDSQIADTIEWDRPRFSERQEERNQLVEEGVKNQGVKDKSVLQAMRHVPRHLFVPERYRQYAYQNRPLPIGHDQTISQPFIVGYTTEMLELEAGKKVLEIGTGSGYQAAVMSEITPNIYTIEIVEPLGTQAINRFEKLEYHTIKTKIGNGYKGWPEHAPFDAIILTAAPEEIPEPLINQLAKGGILVAPVGEAGETQILTKVTKSQEGEVNYQRNIPVRFVPMTGEIESP